MVKKSKTKPAQLDDRAFLARKRVGEKPLERLRWVIEFSRKDLSLLQPEERIALSYELHAIAWHSATSHGGKVSESRSLVTSSESYSDSFVQELHAKIKTGLDELVTGEGRLKVKQPNEFTLYRSSADNAKRIRFDRMLHFSASAIEEAILYGVADTLLEGQGLLRACAECQRPFIPVRRQEYCSIKCSQKARDRRRSR